MKRREKCFSGILIFELILCCLGINNGCRGKTIDYTHPSAKLTAQAFFSEFKDEKKAYEKYLGKLVEIGGIIERTGTDSANRPFILFKGDESGDVQCFFAKDYEEKSSQMKKGESVTVCGTVFSRVIHVALDSCIIVKN